MHRQKRKCMQKSYLSGTWLELLILYPLMGFKFKNKSKFRYPVNVSSPNIKGAGFRDLLGEGSDSLR